MKKYFIALAAIVFAAVACNKEVDNVQPVQKVKRHITVLTETPGTRTVLDDEHNALLWAPGDNFRLMTNTEDEDANHDAQTLTYAENGKFDAEVSEDATVAYAYYFAGTYTDANHSTPTAYTAYINPTQTQSKAGVLNGQNLPMAAKGTINADNTVSLEFHQMAGVLALNIYSTSKVQGETIKSVKVIPAEANTNFCAARTGTDLTVNNVVYDQGTSASNKYVIVNLEEPYDYASAKPTDKKMFDSQIYVVLAKQSYSAVTFEITTNTGEIYEITSNSTAFDLVNNDFYPVNINLAKATFLGVKTFDTTDADYSTGFESEEEFVATTTYNNSNLAYFGPKTGMRWDTYYGTVSTNSYLAGAQSMQLRWYKDSPENLGFAETYFYLTKIGYVSFKAAATNGLKIGLYYKAKTSEEWTLAKTFTPTTSSATYTYCTSSIITDAQIRFGIILPDTAPTSNSNIRIDDIVIKKQAPTYTVTIDNEITNGTVTASSASAFAGDEISLTITPDNDYRLDYLSVTTDGGGRVTVDEDFKFIMPEENVTVFARFVSTSSTELVLYYEDFGTSGSNTVASAYEGWSWTGTNHPDGWKVSKNSLTGNNNSSGAYEGASGSCNLYSGTSGETAVIAFGNVSAYTGVTLSFGWANNAGAGKARTMTVEVSGDGSTWTSIGFTDSSNATTNDGFHLCTYVVPAAYLSNFSIRFTNTAGNQSRIDDVKLVASN